MKTNTYPIHYQSLPDEENIGNIGESIIIKSGPSEQIIDIILAYSRALYVKKCKKGLKYIEYSAN
jgi:hypothetical protein